MEESKNLSDNKSKSKRISKDFTTGSIAKQVLWFSIPFMLSNALQVLYSTIDMIIVGKFVGTAGLSAVSQSSQIINFAVMVCLGFSNAGQVLVAQAVGAKKRKEMSEIIGTLFCFVTLVALAFTVIMLILANPILTVMKIPTESYAMAYDYIIISAIGLFFTAGYNMVSAVLRGMGDGKRPLLFIGIASAVNLVLDIIFVGVLNMSVAGAAWATIIGQGVSFLFSLFYLYRRKEAFGFDFKPESFRMKQNYSLLIFKLGTPMAVQSGFINVSMMFVNAMINNVSLVASATFGVGVRIDDIINKISQGIQYAAMPIISQNDGAGDTHRMKGAVKWAIIYSLALTAIFMTLYITLGEQLFRMFSSDPAVHEMSHTFIKAILWMFPAFAIMRGSGAFIQGIGHAKLCMALAMLDGVVLRIGLSWFFGTVLGWGFYGYVLGYGLAPYGYAIPSMLYFLFGKWQKRKSLSSEI